MTKVTKISTIFETKKKTVASKNQPDDISTDEANGNILLEDADTALVDILMKDTGTNTDPIIVKQTYMREVSQI